MALTDLTANLLDSHEPQRTNNCLLIVDGLYGASGSAVQDATYVALALDSFSLPEFQVAPMPLAYLNETRKFATKPEYTDITAVFKDLLDINIAAIMYAWFVQVFDASCGRIGYATSYKKTGHVVMYPPDGGQNGGTSTTTILGVGSNDAHYRRQWKAQGVWPSSFNMGEANMEDASMVRVSMTFSVDKLIPEAYGTSSLTGSSVGTGGSFW